jgi:hypothetical protein
VIFTGTGPRNNAPAAENAIRVRSIVAQRTIHTTLVLKSETVAQGVIKALTSAFITQLLIEKYNSLIRVTIAGQILEPAWN